MEPKHDQLPDVVRLNSTTYYAEHVARDIRVAGRTRRVSRKSGEIWREVCKACGRVAAADYVYCPMCGRKYEN